MKVELNGLRERRNSNGITETLGSDSKDSANTELTIDTTKEIVKKRRGIF